MALNQYVLEIFILVEQAKLLWQLKLKYWMQKIKSCFIKKLYSDQTDEKLILEQHGEVFVNHSRKSALYQAMKKDYKIAIFMMDYKIKNYYMI